MTEFKDKVIYQIYMKSFRDSDHDGFGELQGVTEKLDYLQELGVDILWLTPFFSSPQNDNGYDISDYYSIDPLFGTMQDLEELIREAEQRGLSLMFDMVFNHTSTEHEWFRKAVSGDPEYMDYYIFKDGDPDAPPTNWISKFGGPAWEYLPNLGKWYLHLFDKTQADLNWNNPKVREELKQVVRFWKEKGIKGFRFDVVNLISKPEVFQDDMKGDGRRFYTDGPHVHEFLKELVRDTKIEDMVTVGEMSSTDIKNCIRYSRPEEKELSMCFNFHHLKIDYKGGDKWELMDPDRLELKRLLEDWQLNMQEQNGWNAVFWCNHDQPRIVSRLGDDKRYWKESAKMLAACIHLLRGTPYIYQGEEIGMTNPGFMEIGQYRDVESLNYYRIMREQGKTEQEALEVLRARSRDNGRTPMQWSSDKFAGFSDKEPWISIPDNYQTINAKAQRRDPDSVYAFYQKLIRLRKERSVIADGQIEFLFREHPDVMAYRRFHDQEEILAFHNLTKKEVVLPLESGAKEYRLVLGNYGELLTGQGALILRPYETAAIEAY